MGKMSVRKTRLIDLSKMAEMDDMMRVVQSIPMDYRLDLLDRVIRIASLNPSYLGKSWEEYKNLNKDYYKEEEAYRMRTTPEELNALQLGDNREAGGTTDAAMYDADEVRSRLSIVDATMNIRNNLIVPRGKFTPMGNIMKQVPNMIKENIKSIMEGMFQTPGESAGGYWDAPAGEGKTTMFQTFMPRMAAELALNFKPLWYNRLWVKQEGGFMNPKHLFLAEYKKTFNIVPRRFYNFNAKAMNSGSPYVGKGDSMRISLQALLEDNPESIVLVLDEVFTAFTESDPTRGGTARTVSQQGQRFVDLVKETIGNEATADRYKYKLWGLYASGQKKQFEEVGKTSYLEEQMARRLAVKSAVTISWNEVANQDGTKTDRDPVKWLEGAIDAMLMRLESNHIYQGIETIEDIMKTLSSEDASMLKNHIEQKRPLVIRAIYDLARDTFRRPNRIQGQSEFKLAVPAAFSKVVKGVVSGPYSTRVTEDNDWDLFKQINMASKGLEKKFIQLAHQKHDIVEKLKAFISQNPANTPSPISPTSSVKLSARDDMQFVIPDDIFRDLQEGEAKDSAIQMIEDNRVVEENSDILKNSKEQRAKYLQDLIVNINKKVEEWLDFKIQANHKKQSLEISLRAKYQREGDTFAKGLLDFTRLAVCDVDRVDEVQVEKADSGDFANENEPETVGESSEVEQTNQQPIQVEQTAEEPLRRQIRRRPIGEPGA